jgi:hypothetical protein
VERALEALDGWIAATGDLAAAGSGR